MRKGKTARHTQPRSGAARPTRRGPSSKLIAMVAVAAVFVVGGAILVFAMSQPAPAGGLTGGDTSATMGSPDAKVVITEYSDFQCPWCARAQPAVRSIKTDYIDAGKVRLVYRNRAVIGPESELSAQAAFCAGEQGKFWEYSDKLFASQAGENRGAFASGNLKRFAADLGLEAGSFDGCLDSGRYAARVRSETAESNAKGVVSTPTFFVNAIKLEGALPYDQFRKAIDSELRRSQ